MIKQLFVELFRHMLRTERHGTSLEFQSLHLECKWLRRWHSLVHHECSAVQWLSKLLCYCTCYLLLVLQFYSTQSPNGKVVPSMTIIFIAHDSKCLTHHPGTLGCEQHDKYQPTKVWVAPSIVKRWLVFKESVDKKINLMYSNYSLRIKQTKKVHSTSKVHYSKSHTVDTSNFLDCNDWHHSSKLPGTETNWNFSEYVWKDCAIYDHPSLHDSLHTNPPLVAQPLRKNAPALLARPDLEMYPVSSCGLSATLCAIKCDTLVLHNDAQCIAWYNSKFRKYSKIQHTS